MMPSFIRSIVQNLLEGHGAMLGGAQVCGLDQGHGSQVIASANLRLGPVLDGDQELGHGSGKSVREPAFFPAWTVKFMVALRSILERRGSCIRIVAPADLSNRQSVQPFDAPLNVNLARAP